jgi:multimeric flavodoxin WrbA
MQTAFIITGSPRKDGVSARMAALFAQQWRAAAPDNRVVTVNAYEAAVKPCIHCGHCRKALSCIYDDYAVFDEGFKSADVLVAVSPEYGLGFPAPLKAVFDRTQRYYEAKVARNETPFAKHKKALLFTASGGPSAQGASFMREELALVCKLVNAELCAAVSVRNTDRTAPDYAGIGADIAHIIACKLATARSVKAPPPKEEGAC